MFSLLGWTPPDFSTDQQWQTALQVGGRRERERREEGEGEEGEEGEGEKGGAREGRREEGEEGEGEKGGEIAEGITS